MKSIDATMLKLVVESETGLTDEYSISPEKKIIIGRGESANIQLKYDQLASREHCELYFNGTNFLINDLDSANGTQLNQVNINSSIIKHNDLITVGNTIFRVRVESSIHTPLTWTQSETVSEEQNIVETPKKPDFCLFESLEQDTEQEEPTTNIDNQSNFKVETLLWPDFDGKSALCIIAKATYTVEAGEEAKPSYKKIPIFDQTVFFEDEVSIMYETDLVPFKPLTDIVVVGKAYTPDKHPVKMIDVGVKVGDTQQIIRVFGDRSWYQSEVDGEFMISEPETFTSIELKYENAFGGSDNENDVYCRENPIGHGCIVEKSLQNSELRKLPNLEDPSDLIITCESRPIPIGFGFCSVVWAPRINYMGGYEEYQLKDKSLFLPDNFSYRFFNGAHSNLQVEGYLKGDEQVALVNLSSKGRLVFHLPDKKPTVVVRKKGLNSDDTKDSKADESQVTMNLDTLVFIPDEGVFYEVFRGVFQLESMGNLPNLSILVE